MLDRFFGFIFDLPIIKYFKPFYQKRNDIVLYIFFGGLTTIVSFVTFWLFEYIFNLHELIANSISWVAAVAFAFFTNRIWVFNSPTYSTVKFLKQLILFYVGRVFSFLVEMLIIWVFITKLGNNALIIKLIATIIVLVLNYIISKLIVFKKKDIIEVQNDKIID